MTDIISKHHTEIFHKYLANEACIKQCILAICSICLTKQMAEALPTATFEIYCLPSFNILRTLTIILLLKMAFAKVVHNSKCMDPYPQRVQFLKNTKKVAKNRFR